MSYCRWSECDVYAYDSCEGGVRFWVAGDDSFNRLCGTYNEAYQYAKKLRDEHGFDVPSHAIDALREDAIDEAKQYLGPDSAVADMLDENAKLRELAAGIGHLLFILDVDYCAACPRDDINHPCPVHTVKGGECLYETDLRELGMEVSE